MPNPGPAPAENSAEKGQSFETSKSEEVVRPPEKLPVPEPAKVVKEAVEDYREVETLIEQAGELADTPIDVPEVEIVEAKEVSRQETEENKLSLFEMSLRNELSKARPEYQQLVREVFERMIAVNSEINKENLGFRIFGSAAIKAGLMGRLDSPHSGETAVVGLTKGEDTEISLNHSILMEDNDYRKALMAMVGATNIDDVRVKRFNIVFVACHEIGHYLHFKRSGFPDWKTYVSKNPSPRDSMITRKSKKWEGRHRRNYRSNKSEGYSDEVAIEFIKDNQDLLTSGQEE